MQPLVYMQLFECVFLCFGCACVQEGVPRDGIRPCKASPPAPLPLVNTKARPSAARA